MLEGKGNMRVEALEFLGELRVVEKTPRSLLGQLLFNAFLSMWWLKSPHHYHTPNSALDCDFDEMIAAYFFYSRSFLLQSN